MDTITLYWAIFIVLFVVVFIIDMNVMDHRKGPISVKVSLRWTAIWVSLALLYGASLFFFYPVDEHHTGMNVRHIMGIKFIAGYLTEYSLSIDNLFVFIMIFSLMGVSEKNQPKLLHLGILLSIVLRILFILVGMELVERFHWIIYVFGVVLVWTAIKMVTSGDDDHVDPSSNFLYKAASKLFPIDPDAHNPSFFSKLNGKLHITQVFLVFLVIGSTDVLFAIDSIPAIIGVIKEGMTGILTLQEENFIAITSNVFAVMGLISLFFALKGIMGKFRFLKYGVCFILFFIGLKMLLASIEPIEHFFSAHYWVSLTVIVSSLVVSILLSSIIKEKQKPEGSATAEIEK